MTRARTLSLLGNENNFTVTGSNNVGIGSTLPDGKLDVGGDIVVGTAITISSVSGIISATDFYVNGVSITGAAGTWATFTSGGEGGISTTKKVKIENGLEVTGVSTFSGDLTVGGVLTYDDVTNVDSIGIITARSGIRVTGGDSNVVGVSTIVTTTQDDANNHYSLVVRGDDSGVDDESAQFFLGAINSTTRGTVIAAQRKSSSNNHDLIFKTSAAGAVPTERLRVTSDGHLLHGVIADEDTSGNGGVRFINSGDIQIDGDQRALVFRSTNSTAQLQSSIEWWNETGAGVQSKISCERTAVGQAPSDLLFYTSANVDTSSNGGDGEITERLRITSAGGVGIGTTDTTGAKLVVGEGTPNGSGGLRVINSDNNFSAGKECAFMDYTGSAVRLGHLNGASGSAKKIQFLTGGSSKIEIDGGGHLYPSSDNTVNLGFSTARWANVFSADLQLSNEGSSNDVDGTWGQYTIQEGENDLFLLNRRNGKTYKFVLEEVN